MKKLLLLSAMLSLACTVFAQAEPFCQSYIVFAADVNAITVPEGKEFVLLKLYVDCIDGLWQINIDDTMWLIGKNYANQNVSSSREFPEGSAIVESGKNIILKKNPQTQNIYFTLIGYFRDAASQLTCDFNNDHIVNFIDFSVFANNWLQTEN